MKRQILLFFLVAVVLSSCTTAYKTGQTPDDVYFSPQRPQDEYVRTDDRKDGKYEYNEDYYDDRYLRMKVSNRLMWSELNDWYYYDRYSYGYNYYYGTYYNPYNSWNYYYNPYCPRPIVIVGNPKTGGNPSAASYPKYVAPRNFSLASYTNNNYNNINPVSKSGKPVLIRPGTTPSNSSSSSGNNSGLTQRVNKWFSGNNNSSGSMYNNSNSGSGNSGSRPSRSYTPSSSSGSSSSGSSGSSSGGGGGVSRPTRGGH